MKSAASFRSIDEWKSALMNLPENSFFDLLRSVLGNIKTPFSKQKLLDDLYNLLSRDEIRKIIAAYISEQDHMIIAAVALLDEPSPAELETFLAGEFTTAEVHAAVINLEERLILYRFRGESPSVGGGYNGGFKDEKILYLALNPVLEQVLAPFTADTRLLFPSLPPEENAEAQSGPATDSPDSRAAFIADGRIMAALFSFLLGEEELFKVEGEVRKKVLDEGKRIFSNLDLDLAVKVLLRLGLFRIEGRALVSCGDKVFDYCELSGAERLEYWTAALYLSKNESAVNSGAADARANVSPFEIHNSRFSWNRLRELASLIHNFRDSMDHSKVYPKNTLRRFWEFLGRKNARTGSSWASPFFGEKTQYPFELILAAIEETGLLEKLSTGRDLFGWKTSEAISPYAVLSDAVPDRAGGISPAEESDKPEKPVIVMDAAFSFIVYPEISFADAMTLGGFCAVKESAETTVRFEVSRQSVVRAFDHGMKADDIIALLDRLSHNRLEANLGWTLRDWENRYTGVSLHQGIVLALAEDRRYLAAAKPVSSLIQSTLMPGVYLLSTEDKAEAVRALTRAGVDIVAQPPNGASQGSNGAIQGFNGPGKSRDSFHRNSFTRLESSRYAEAYPVISLSGSGKEMVSAPGKRKKSPAPQKADKSGSPDSSDSIKQNFRQALEKVKMSKQEKEEFLARIERRLILTEAQLEGTSLRYEKLEARGLDYAGKLAIARQAIETGSLVDVSWPGQEGLDRTTGIAQALEKQEGDSVLVLRSGEKNDRDAKVLRIPLGKISLIRRIKQSIFGE